MDLNFVSEPYADPHENPFIVWVFAIPAKHVQSDENCYKMLEVYVIEITVTLHCLKSLHMVRLLVLHFVVWL